MLRREAVLAVESFKTALRMDSGTRPTTSAAVSHGMFGPATPAAHPTDITIGVQAGAAVSRGMFGPASPAARRMPTSTGVQVSVHAIPTTNGMGLHASPHHHLLTKARSTR
jgi:hypothetical protein